MKKLDRSKPLNEVVGDDPSINYRYIQDGVKFDNQGNEVVDKPAEKKEEPKSAGGGVLDEIKADAPAAAGKGGKKSGGAK